MTAGESCNGEEVKNSMDLICLTAIVCPKCGQKSPHFDADGVGNEPVVVCDKCGYCSLDRNRVEVSGEGRNSSKECSDFVKKDDELPKDEREEKRHLVADLVDELSVTTSALKCTTCGNVNEDLFEKLPDLDSETVVLYCQTCNQLTSKWVFECEDCGNCSPEWFQQLSGDLTDTQLICLSCLKVSKPDGMSALLKILKKIEKFKDAKRSLLFKEEPKRTHKKVRDLQQLRRGDHIAWDREYLVWHHAIVTDVDAPAGQITVIHNSGGIKDLPNGRIASVRVETFKVDCNGEFLYVFEYNEDECFSPEEVIERATQRLDESYDPLTNNCEHYARWCKTGVKSSLQRKDFDDRLKMGASGFAKVIEESLMTAVRFFGNSESIQDILGISAKDAWAIIEARLGVLTDSRNLIRGLQLGAVLTGVMLAIFAEIVFFCCKLYEAKKDADAKHMPADVFQRGVFQLFSEGLAGLGGGLGAAFGMSLVPYAGPFLSPIGYVLGNWVGRFLGALIGRLFMRILHRYVIMH